MYAFGPFPSRRLGMTVGINNLSPKTCSYSCIYCQCGDTQALSLERKPGVDPEEIRREVSQKIKHALSLDEEIDYISFDPNGEPTLDSNLGRTIELLKTLGLPIAVLTNGSLLWREDVREELMKADWVSVKVDTVNPKVWRRLNRPHRRLNPENILEGIRVFASRYQGDLNTETMLVHGVNDSPDSLREVGKFLGEIQPACAFLSIPTRPPAEPGVSPPFPESLSTAWNIFRVYVENVQFLIGYEGNEFAFTGDAEEDILSITAVHPMRREALEELLMKANESWSLVRRILSENKLVETTFEGKKFYLRSVGQIGFQTEEQIPTDTRRDR